MAVQKNFIVRNGLEINNNLLVADTSTDHVGVGTSNPKYTLEVIGGIGATYVDVLGIATVGQTLNVGTGGTVITSLNTGLTGFGTQSPAYIVDIRSPVSTGQTALYVQGDVEITGDLSVDDINLDQATFNNIEVTGVGTIATALIDLGYVNTGIVTNLITSGIGTIETASINLGYVNTGIVTNLITSGIGSITIAAIRDGYINTGIVTNLVTTGIASIATGVVTDAYVTTGIVTNLVTSGIGSITTAVIDTGYVNTGIVTNLVTTGIASISVGVVTDAYVTTGIVTNLVTSGIGSITTAAIDTGYVTTGIITNLTTTGIASISVGVVTDAYVTTGIVTNLVTSGIGSITTAAIDTGYVTTGIITNLTTTGIASIATGVVTDAYVTTGIVTTLTGTTLDYSGIGTIATLNSTDATITTIDATNVTATGIVTANEYTINGTTVVNSSRELQNIASLDATTTATIEAAIANAPNTFQDIEVTGIATVNVGVFTSLYANAGIITTLSGANIDYSGIGTIATLNSTDATITTIDATDLTVTGITTVNDLEIGGYLSAGSTTGKTNQILVSTGTGVTWANNGIVVQENSSTVGTAGSIQILNFIGSGIGVTITSASDFGVDINISEIKNPPGKTVYVAVNGSDSDDGLTLDHAKRTIKAAVGITTSGDTVKVLPGTYVEDNPITLPENVSIEGAELRNCIVSPQNPGSDLFWVSNGNHITDLSFTGQTATGDSAVIAFKPLVGVASNRFFDAARIIRYNLDFIASEAVSYISSTSYQNPAVSISTTDYKNYIKSTCLAACHDITRGGNSKCVGVGLSFYTGGIINAGIGTTTIDALVYAAGIAKSCINNVLWTGNYQNEFTQLRDLSIQSDPDTGSNVDINSCANVVSAIYSCVGVVTTIIGVGTGAVGTSFNLTYPGNAGIGTTNPNDIPSQGVGNVTKGPYIRNCTNFIPGSVGMRVDGFHAEPGDSEDIGITGMMSVDSYTQYNQGGIGVEILNGAYAQLVSIFTICDDKAIVTKDGGQCDITNSNSSFGTYGLVSDGVSDPTSLSIYRFTGNVASASSEGDLTVVISGIGKEKPYSGQAVYFDELYYEIEGITITDGGSGYTESPTVTFPISPTGPSSIAAEAIATIEDGRVISVDMIGNGRNYRLSDAPTVTFSGPTGVGSTASGVVNLKPLYYQVRSATAPSSGVSTVTFAQPLNNDVGIGTTAFLFRQSLQIVSSHSFEYIGAGNTIEFARPSKGGVTIRENEVVKLNGGEIVYTSTDQDGNFAIGEDLIINQSTGTISGRAFERSLLNTVTPFIIALGAK